MSNVKKLRPDKERKLVSPVAPTKNVLSMSILDSNFKYRDSAATNVLETFKRAGWVPPSEKKVDNNQEN